MALKPGYKQTEVGVIPKEWNLRSLEGIADPKGPICYGIVQVGAFVGSGIPVLAIKNLNTDYRSNVHQCSPEIEAPYARSRIRTGDILVSVKGTTGRVGIVPPHFNGNISRDLARIRVSDEHVPQFWFHMLQSEAAQRELDLATVGTTRLELSIGILKQVMMPCPLSDEQSAIAAVLSDMDALIASLDKLIAKKRDIKQATMQQLLTGKTRLPGFEQQAGVKQTEVGAIPVDWDARQIGEVCMVINGRGFKPHEWGTSGLPIIRIQNLNGSGDFNCYAGSYDSKIVVENGQLLFAWSGSRGTSFGPYLWRGSRALLNYHTWKIVPNESKVVTPYFFHALRNLTSHIEDKAHGASALVHTQKWEMEQFHVLVPSLREQRAIATVLSDMDGEITALEARRDKTKLLKQGMMQELLAGRIRLI